MNIGEKLRIYREYRNLTQDELASKAGINEKYYGRIEREESCPTIKKLEQICKALDIDIIELFLFEKTSRKNKFYLDLKISSIIVDAFKNDIDMHFNRDIIINGYENCIWYNGFIGSMSFDEFEFKLYATGNIKAKLYINYHEVLELNSSDVYNELVKYINDDNMLEELIELMEFDKKTLEEKNGNVFFIIDYNWLTVKLVNNLTHEVINENIILDTNNIIEALNNKKLFFDYIFYTDNSK